MARPRGIPALVIAAALVGAGTGTAAAAPAPSEATLQATRGPLVVLVSGRSVDLAGFRGRQTLGQAIERFGKPTRRTRGQNACYVFWRPIGLSMIFANFGGQDACAPSFGYAQTARLVGTRWRTARGLRPGASLATLRRIYPGARLREGKWWIRTATSPIGAGGEYAVLAASVRDGKVRSLDLYLGRAGD